MVNKHGRNIALGGLVNKKKIKNPKKTLDTINPTHPPLYQKKFWKISKIFIHEYLYIEARTKA